MALPILSSLFFLLLLLINGHGISAREMRVELPEQKQVDQPYITAYRTTAVADKEGFYGAGYKAAYTSTEHSHPSHHKESQQERKPYITQYGLTKKDSKVSSQYAGYNALYKASVHDPDLSKPYVTQYGTTKKDSKVSPQYAGYNALYKASVHDPDLSKPYVTQYGTTKKDSKVSPQYAGYNALYKASVHDPDLSQEIPKQELDTHHKTSYEASYNKGSEDSYAATYRKGENSYVATYQKAGQGPSSKVDHTEAFKTGFFALDDLYVGNVMTLQFGVEDFPHFLPRKEAESIPFSMSQLPSVLQLFSVPEDSPQGQAMRGTLEQCEAETLTGETKLCVTSLESMLELVRTIIGSEANLNILTTSFPTTPSATFQNYTILKVSQDIYAPKWVACHPLPYPYAVYFCHFIGTGTKVFKVSLRGEKGDIMEALGLCHLDTSEWNPDHILFQQLGFKPGAAPVCHFFPVKHLLWVPLPPTATM